MCAYLYSTYLQIEFCMLSSLLYFDYFLDYIHTYTQTYVRSSYCSISEIVCCNFPLLQNKIIPPSK